MQDLKSQKALAWQVIQVAGSRQPINRVAHLMVPIDHDKIFIAGGLNNVPHCHLGDAWIFDAKTFSFKLAFDDTANFRHSSDYN